MHLRLKFQRQNKLFYLISFTNTRTYTDGLWHSRQTLGRHTDGLGHSRQTLGRHTNSLGHSRQTQGRHTDGLGHSRQTLGRRTDGLGHQDGTLTVQGTLGNLIPYKMMYFAATQVKNCGRKCIFSGQSAVFHGREKQPNISILTMCKIST